MVGNNISHLTNLVYLTVQFNPLQPNISMHILHTILFTFPTVLTGRICLTIKSFFSWWSFILLWTLMSDS